MVEVQDISAKSNKMLADMPGMQWQESYLAYDKLYCVYLAPGAESVMENTRRRISGGQGVASAPDYGPHKW